MRRPPPPATSPARHPRRRDPLPGGRRVRFDHALAEAAPYPDCSFDLVAFQYVAHECPQAAIRSFISEARRLLRPGGVVVFVDNNPRSPRLQSMPPAMFTLMKSSGARGAGALWVGARAGSGLLARCRARAEVPQQGGQTSTQLVAPGAPLAADPRPSNVPTHLPPEPWSDEFYSLELESALVKGGFRAIWTMPVNTSHHAVFGQLPPEAA